MFIDALHKVVDFFIKNKAFWSALFFFTLTTSIWAIYLGSDFPVSSGSCHKWHSSVAFDSVNHRYLVVWESCFREERIYGQFINANGTVYGEPFSVSDHVYMQVEPYLSYDPVSQHYLVVWNEFHVWGSKKWGYDVNGQILNAEGDRIGETFSVSPHRNGQWNPSISVDLTNNRFLVLWEETKTKHSHIYGQIINAEGNFIGNDFVVADYQEGFGSPTASYDSENKRFFVAWEDKRKKTVALYGQLINVEGTHIGKPFTISTTIDGREHPEVISYDSINRRFLVTWVNIPSYPAVGRSIYSRLVNSDGTLHGNVIPISPNPDPEYDALAPSVAFDPISKSFLIVWQEFRKMPSHIYGRIISSNGSLVKEELPIISEAKTQTQPSLAFNPKDKNFLVVWSDERWKERGIRGKIVSLK